MPTNEFNKTAQLLAALRRHYINPNDPEPGGIFVHEVTPNGYWGCERRCDAIYLGLTNASGRVMIGHELKTSRSDWLRELDNARKADDWADECHEFWLVVSDPAIVQDGELPAGWGLMSPSMRRNSRRMTKHSPATRNTKTPSWDATRSVLARAERLRAEELRAAIRQAHVDAGREASIKLEEQWKRRIANTRSLDAEQLRERLIAIETALGAQIDWTAEEYRLQDGSISLSALTEIAAAVRGYSNLECALDQFTGRYSNPIELARKQLDGLETALAGLKQLCTIPASQAVAL